MVTLKGVNEELYKVSYESIGLMTLKKMEGIKYSIGQISNWVTKWIMVSPEEIRKALRADGYREGRNKHYIGLVGKHSNEIEEFKDEITKAIIFEVNFALDKACHKEIQTCIWSDENINKFRLDMIKIGRLYQEKTIDYAKKLCKLDIINSPMRHIQLLSIAPMNVALGEDRIIITPPIEDENKIVVNDIINQVRLDLVNEYKEFVDEKLLPAIKSARLPKDMAAELERRRYGDVEAFVAMKEYYKDISGGYIRVSDDVESGEDEETSLSVVKEQFKEDKARIENMIRLATQYMSPEERGAYMKYIAGRTKNNQKRTDGSENRFYQALCREEFLRWLISLGLNEIDFAGYKLLNNKGYVDGDMVWFENGQAAKAIIDGTYTGWLTIREYNNKLYATVDIKDLIVVPEPNNKIIIKVQQGFVSKHGADKIIRAINTSRNVVIKSGGKDGFVMDIINAEGKKCSIPYDLRPVFFKMFKDLTGKIVKVSKNTVRTQAGMLVDSVYISIDLDTVPEGPEVTPIKLPEALTLDDIVETDEIM